MKQNSLRTVEKSSYFRLSDTVSALWEECGHAAMSARQISALADAPVSSIYHHFGSLEQLFRVSQKDCLSRAEQWCDAELDQIAGLDIGIQGFAAFFAHIVDEWTQRHRPLAFAWRECELLAVRNSQFEEQALLWRSMWRDFWGGAGEIFGLGSNVFIAERLFDSESLLHLIRWRRPIDRAALGETAQGIACWLAGKPAPDAPWRAAAHAEALRRPARTNEPDPTVTLIMQAAAEQVAAYGVIGVTHRAIAERAGLTLGTVSHRFRTKSALLYAAFEGLYAAINEPTTAPQQSPPRPTCETIANDVARMEPQGFRIAGGDDLALAAARDPALSGFGMQLRYLRGRASRELLQALLPPQRYVSSLEGSLLSGFINAQLRRHYNSKQDAGSPVYDELSTLLSLLIG